ncbi:MAG TPA: hypothetical protein PLV92_14285 [Pirellulaceae bacterium]|nr:hypothetical protein [Pirellulaceae bacterium]
MCGWSLAGRDSAGFAAAAVSGTAYFFFDLAAVFFAALAFFAAFAGLAAFAASAAGAAVSGVADAGLELPNA